MAGRILTMNGLRSMHEAAAQSDPNVTLGDGAEVYAARVAMV
jgi:hypothetical protein